MFRYNCRRFWVKREVNVVSSKKKSTICSRPKNLLYFQNNSEPGLCSPRLQKDLSNWESRYDLFASEVTKFSPSGF